MGASRYVGRVGGLAIALGVGTAILTGQGVANADEGGAGGSSSSASSSSESSAGSTADSTLGAPASDSSETPGKHRQTDGTSLADTVTAIRDRIAEQREKRAAAAAEKAAADSDVGTDGDTADDATPRSDRRSHRSTPATDSTDTAPSSDDAGGSVSAPAAEPRALSWLTTPRAAAGRAASEPATAITTLWTPRRPAVTETAPVTTAPAPTTVVAGLATAIDRFFSPFSAGGQSAPVGGSLTDLLLLAGTRRQLALAQADPVDGTSLIVDEGLIGGCIGRITCTAADGSSYTVLTKPSNGGKLALDAQTGAFTFLPFASETATNGPTGHETFTVLVAQNTKFTTFVTGIPIVGSTLIAPVIVTLQQINGLNTLLAPIIGTSHKELVDVDIDALRGEADTPVAFTTMVTSFDGTKISTNFFPAIGATGDEETIFYGPGLGQPGATDPTTDPFTFLSSFRQLGYNVVTWDPRGEFASGGVLQLDNPKYEGQDVSAIISWVAGQPGVELDAPNDPRMGMVGVSYGGAVQWATAVNDGRIDAIAPAWSWNTLPSSLYPDKAFKTAYSSLLLLGLVTTGARINPLIYSGILTGDLLGVLTPRQIALLEASGPGAQVGDIDIPTLIIQGTVDVLFPLQQSLLNLGYLANNPNVKTIWYCGGHGSCLPGQGDELTQTQFIVQQNILWMNEFVKDLPVPADPNAFEWFDQTGTLWGSQTRPTDAGFTDATSQVPTTTWADGKVLPIVPILGGSGPNPQVDFPYSLGDGSIATNAVTIALTNPTGDVNVVGAPKVTIDYSGFGTSRHLYAQVVDTTTGQVVGNLVTQVPVTLNGKDQQATVDLNDIAYRVGPNSKLELQIFTTATPFLNLTQFGFVNVKSVSVTLPTTSAGAVVAAAPSADVALVAV